MVKNDTYLSINTLRSFIVEHSIWLVAAAFSVAMGLLSETRLWQSLENRAFDALTVATCPNVQETPIFIVGIDDLSITTLGLPWPWPRSLYAELIEALNQAGAGVIIFDMIFERPSDPDEDMRLAEAIHDAGNVVLGASLTLEDSEYGTLQRRQNPMPELVEAGAQVGTMAMEIDVDRIIRRIPAAPDALWRIALQSLKRRVPDLSFDLFPSKRSYLRYLGPPNTFQHIPFVQALELAEQPGIFDNALLLVGRSAAITTDIASSQADTFVTPLTWSMGTVMSGVEIHATAIENAIRAQAINSIHPAARWLLITLIAFGSVFSMERVQIMAGIGITTGWLLLTCSSVFGLWLLQQLFLPPLLLMGIPIGALTRRIVIVARQERQNRLELKRIFSLYLSPRVVEEISDQPDKVELGGEQRYITVLFTDLENFTTLSERLPPRIIANLLNDYFELMTQAVFRYQGTLDKFIGDAVMAFWGAPIPQEDHPQRAVACAIDMLSALESFNHSLLKQGQSLLRMRIGIHTGIAVVGNLGCPSRFSYTAIGDTVNVAARLESANKDHDTSILMSEETVKGLPLEITTQFVAKIQVKGRKEPVTVYTCPNKGSFADLKTLLKKPSKKEEHP